MIFFIAWAFGVSFLLNLFLARKASFYRSESIRNKRLHDLVIKDLITCKDENTHLFKQVKDLKKGLHIQTEYYMKIVTDQYHIITELRQRINDGPQKETEG